MGEEVDMLTGRGARDVLPLTEVSEAVMGKESNKLEMRGQVGFMFISTLGKHGPPRTIFA